MNRLLVALLCAFDAVVAAVVGLAAAIAPLALLWLVGIGFAADWTSLWPAGAAVWQLGHRVPIQVILPPEYLAVAGIPVDAASFWLSLAPLAFASFTAVFAARSGARAARSEGWIGGAATGSIVFATISATVALTSRTTIVAAELWLAIVLPTFWFAVALLVVGTGYLVATGATLDIARALVGPQPWLATAPAE